MSHPLDEPLISALTEKMLEAVYTWESSKAKYAKLREEYLRGLTRGSEGYKIAEYSFGRDTLTTKAIKDCAHYREEAATYAAVIQALRG